MDVLAALVVSLGLASLSFLSGTRAAFCVAIAAFGSAIAEKSPAFVGIPASGLAGVGALVLAGDQFGITPAFSVTYPMSSIMALTMFGALFGHVWNDICCAGHARPAKLSGTGRMG
jgi:hypothetical protein